MEPKVMRFKQQQNARFPEINVIPMLTVMMGTVGFFVVVTLGLAAQQAVDVTLPSSEANPTPATPDPLVVSLNAQGQILVQDQVISKPQLDQQIQTYLGQNSQGSVLLNPQQQLPYEQVIQVLGEMRAVGGDRVSLGIE